MTFEEYWKRSRAVMGWNPNPFQPHPSGPWHERNFDLVVERVINLLARFRQGDADEHHLLHGKDNGPTKKNTLSYWLYYQHHPGSEKWKLMGQRYWSVEAWRSWCESGGRSFPKRGSYGDRGLVSEHVVPQKKLKALLKDCDPSDHAAIRRLLEHNLCCVVTRVEDKRLPSHEHPNIDDPWLRYAGRGIVLLHNPVWGTAEAQRLFQHELIRVDSLEQ